MDIVNQIGYLQKQLDKSIKLLRQTGEQYAKAYTEYRVALAKELLQLKNDFIKIIDNSDSIRLYKIGKIVISPLITK